MEGFRSTVQCYIASEWLVGERAITVEAMIFGPTRVSTSVLPLLQSSLLHPTKAPSTINVAFRSLFDMFECRDDILTASAYGVHFWNYLTH